MERLRIAVVGSGCAGLSAAYFLAGKHEVTMYERHAAPGMDASSIDVCVKGHKARVDVPLRVFSDQYYPNLSRLYDHVGLDVQPENYASSFSFPGGKTYFSYRNLLLGSLSVPFVSLKGMLSLKFARMALAIAYFLYQAPKHLAQGKLDGLTIGDYLRQEGYSEFFITHFMNPAVASMNTCTYKSAEEYPADIIVSYMSRRSLRGVRRVTQGTVEVCARLTEGIKELRTSAGVTRIRRVDNGTRVEVTSEDGTVECYDRVVIAAQAHIALAMLGDDALPEERAALEKFRYEESHMVVHSDEELMPESRDHWASVNFFTSERAGVPMCSIWMNRVMDMGEDFPVDVFQTLNPYRTPREGTVFATATFDRPIINARAARGIELLDAAQGVGNVFFCGSYAWYGMPLLESAVNSSLDVVAQLGTPAPWWHASAAARDCGRQTGSRRWSGFLAFCWLLLAMVLSLVLKMAMLE